jgi:hypothetical protein
LINKRINNNRIKSVQNRSAGYSKLSAKKAGQQVDKQKINNNRFKNVQTGQQDIQKLSARKTQ